MFVANSFPLWYDMAFRLMLSQGIHPKIVSERLGHSSIEITIDLCSHLLPTVQGEAASRFGAEWKNRNGKRMAN